jgi:hypothetical protein
VLFIFCTPLKTVSLKESNMKRDSLLIPKANLSAYKKFIEKYLPYVLAKCSEHTSKRHLSEIIAIYVFAAAYHLISRDGLIKRLDDSERMHAVLDSVFYIVGKDFADPEGCSPADKSIMSGGFNGGKLERITCTVMDYLSSLS